MSPNKRSRLLFIDWLLTLDTKPSEFLTSLISFGIGLRIAKGKAAVLQDLSATHDAVAHWLPILGWAVVWGAMFQIAALVFSYGKGLPFARVMRWSCSVIDGAVWITLCVFLLGTVPLSDSLYLIYAALLVSDGWIVMAIAYRGYRGRDPT